MIKPNDIQIEFIKKIISDSLNQLIEFDVKSQNITEEILKYSKDLPPGLEDFYFQAFKSLDTVSSNILYMLYFCPKAVSFDSFYNLILLLLNKSEVELDKKEFHNKYFSSIEMFLSINHDNNYKFYHLSVKESIKSYFSILSIIFISNSFSSSS